MRKKAELIITADDFGLSPGINRAITDLYRKKAITRTSVLINSAFARDAFSLMRKKCPGMPVGIHLALTCGTCGSDPADIPLLADDDGNMKLTYGKLLLLALNPFTRRNILRQIELEFDSQISALRRKKIRVNHIDGHQHVHMIPGIFSVVVKLAEKHAVSDLRIVHERYFLTGAILKPGVRIGVAGIVKFLILKAFRICARAGQRRYLFSILRSCDIRPGMIDFDRFVKLRERFAVVEIMLHPGNAVYDRAFAERIDPREKAQALSGLRAEEFSAALEMKSELGRRGW